MEVNIWATSLPGAQVCPPIIEMGISTLQLEHLMVGKKLDARIVDVMVAFHLLLGRNQFEECSLVDRSRQLFVYVLRACNLLKKGQVGLLREV